jgi:hypothetical protein
MITYELIDTNIFYVRFTGKTSVRDIAEYLDEFKSVEDLPADIRLLYDITDAEMNLNVDDIHQISKLAEEATQRYTSVKTAFLVNHPLLTAYSVLFSEFKSSSKTNRKIFSTVGAATDWLNE